MLTLECWTLMNPTPESWILKCGCATHNCCAGKNEARGKKGKNEWEDPVSSGCAANEKKYCTKWIRTSIIRV